MAHTEAEGEIQRSSLLSVTESTDARALSNDNSVVPFFTVDSDYLKSLLGGKGKSYELVESASIKSSGEFSSPSFIVDHSHIPPSSSMKHQRNESGNRNFLSECETQLDKLNVFMEQHLTSVERDLLALQERKSDMSDSVSSVPKMAVNRLQVKYFHSDSSDDSDLDEESVKLISDDTDGDRNINSSNDLSHLRNVLLSLERSLSSSFTALDQLATQHDNQTMTRNGQDLMLSRKYVRMEFERRLNRCREKVDTELSLVNQGKNNNNLEEGYNKENVKIPQLRLCLPFFMGMLFVLVLGVLSFMYLWDRHPSRWKVYLRFVRGPLFVLLCIYLFGINIRRWAASNISYISIFQFNPKGVLTSSYMFKIACIFTTIFTILVAALLVSSPFTTDYIGNVVPLLMWLILLVFLFNPFNILLRRARIAFILVCVRILLAPFTFVRFGDFFLADQLNSTVAILLDMEYLICYSFIGPWTGQPDEKVCTSSTNGVRPVIACLPALWRLLQCIRCFYNTRKVSHLLNAVKYFTTFPVVVCSLLFSFTVNGYLFNPDDLDFDDIGWIVILWLISAFVHAIYTFIWDIHRDWGLWNFSKRTFFRPTLIYHHKIIYLLAMVFDLILRFLWTLKLTLAIVWHLDSDLIYSVLVVAEILRRFVWNFFRVEYAHVLDQEK